MSRTVVGPWLVLLVPAVVLIAAVVAHSWRVAPPRPMSDVMVLEPDPRVLSRLDAKQRITTDLIAGRVSLLEAAAGFKALDVNGRPYPDGWGAGLPRCAGEDEAYCRSVISWVRAEAPHDRVEALARRLEAELAVRLRDGTLRLPES